MRLNRLLEITTILLNKKSCTAGELAERFQVSIRTIYRDIDVLSASGVPVYCAQGKGGGISILEDYTVNRAALSGKERDNVLFALQTLQSTKYPEIDTVLEKLGGIFQRESADWISIDFSPWGSNPNANNKFNHIKGAILQNRVIEIAYINSQNEKSYRRLEPLRLIFKSHSWYLWGYCLTKQDYRTFRISRIKSVQILDVTFSRRPVHMVKESLEEASTQQSVHLVLEFSRDVLYRLRDDYDEEQLQPVEGGTYRLELDFPEDEWVYGYLLSFGTSLRILEPEYIKAIIKKRSQGIADLYS